MTKCPTLVPRRRLHGNEQLGDHPLGTFLPKATPPAPRALLVPRHRVPLGPRVRHPRARTRARSPLIDL